MCTLFTILLAQSNEGLLFAVYAHLQKGLEQAGLVIAPEKIKREAPFSYLGYTLYPRSMRPQKIEIRKDNIKTLNDFQKLLGDINWVRPSLDITTGELKALFDVLKGNSDPNSPREITPEARQALTLVG